MNERNNNSVRNYKTTVEDSLGGTHLKSINKLLTVSPYEVILEDVFNALFTPEECFSI